MKATSLLSLLIACVTGCASGDHFSAMHPPPDKALVYIYRPNQIQWLAGVNENATPHRIVFNGQFACELLNGGYCPYLATPGTNSIGCGPEFPASWPDSLGYTRKEILRTNFEAGATYYLRFSLGAWGPKMKFMEPSAAEAEIRKCKQ